MNRILWVVLFLDLLLTACYRRTDEKEQPVIRTIDTTFYNGKIETISEVSAGRREGWTYFYDKDNNMVRKMYFEEGIQTGPDTFFYSNGSVQQTLRWFNGKPFGDAICYSERGKIEKYFGYDLHDLRYIEEYDIDGHLRHREGKILMNEYAKEAIDSNFALKNLTYYVCTADPPFTEETFSVELFGPDGELIERKEVSSTENTIILEWVFPKKGRYISHVFAQLHDRNNNLVYSDTLIRRYDIKER